MTTNRRDFIRTSSVLAAGTILLPSFTLAKSKMQPGLQVYSVRNQLNEDFEGTMEHVAKVGYKHIEGYGLGTDGKFRVKKCKIVREKNLTKLGLIKENKI